MDAIARGLATRALAEIALIDTGQPVELRRTSTHLQWRRVGDTNWTNLVPLVETGSALDFNWDGTSLGVKRQTETEYAYVDLIGPQGVQGVKGDTGASLEFTWNGTELGVRVEGESNYQFVDLQADPIGIGDGLEADGSGTVSDDNTVVRTTRSITAGAGLTGGGDLSAEREIALDGASQAALGLAESAVQPDRSITTGAGLTGGGTLAADRSLAIAEGGVTPTLTQRLQFRTVTANTTLALGDVDGVVEVNSTSARTVTVPTNASVALPIGTVIEIVRWGAGAVTISPASGVTLHSPDGEIGASNIARRYGSAFLRKRSANQWHLSGDLE